jgi:hypothetical protein
MACLDMNSYRELVLRGVENCLIDSRDLIPGFTSFSLNQAIRSELTDRADPYTGLIEVTNDLCCEMDMAADRILDHMSLHRDLGFGRSS